MALVLVTLFTARSAHAYNIDGRAWTLNRTVVMHLSLGPPRLLQDGFSSYDQSAADALNVWNTYLAHAQFAARMNSSLTPGDGDSDNSVFFSSNVYGAPFGVGVLAVTTTFTRGTTITEADTVFNTVYDWDSYRGPLQSEAQEFHRVALHEFGHALGLHHPDEANQRVTAIMNSRVSNVETPQTDDINGVQSLYGSGPSYRAIPASSNLVALSTRGFVGTGDRVLIGGFTLDGSQATSVIVRAVAHSLAGYGIANALSDSFIELHNANGTVLATNDDWIDSADAQTIASYHLDPPNSTESAILRTLVPGDYTAIVRAYDNGDGNLTGTGLVEIYDLHSSSGGRAASISTRGQVLTGDDVIIGGLNIGGSQPKEVIVRGIGPSLGGFGVNGVLADPRIEVYNASQQLIAANDNWQSDPRANVVQLHNLAPASSLEAALDLVLNPGAYTVVLRGVNNSTGIGLVQVYDTAPAP